MRKRILLYAALSVLLLTCSQLSARCDNGQNLFLVTVQGVVSDSSGNPLPGAEVRIININNTPALTNENGFYHIQRGISCSGIIILKISKPGYITITKANIVIHEDGPFSFVCNCTLPEQP